jgi:hypothetical protein
MGDRKRRNMGPLATIRIYIDADACPVKDEVYRVAARHGLPVSVVANGFIRVPQAPSIERIAAGSAPDAADDWIGRHPAGEPLGQGGRAGDGTDRQAIQGRLNRDDVRGAQPDV